MNKILFDEWITIDKDIMGGSPVIQGTRITTSSIFYLLRGGHSIKELHTFIYPKLTEKQVVIAYLYELLERE